MNYKKPKVISEIGCNHMGQMAIAKELIELSKLSGADVAKFQKRTNKELLTEEQYNAPHPNPRNSYGDTYGAHREFLEFTKEQHKELKEYCDKVGIEYSTSVWDVTSAKEIVEVNPTLIKVPSACNNHFEMMKILRDDYTGEVHISTGMTKKDEIETIISFFEVTGAAKDRLVVYNCTSGYPVPFEDVCLLEINNLVDKYADRVKEIGFSGHHLGIAIDMAAYTLGASWVERHFTKDRTWKGTDHAASLEVTGLMKLCRDLKATHQALNFKKEEILPIEQVQRDKLKYRKS
ncbi:N-acetylneuraminate synthase family protein [Flammeovirga yaeyamensis]|uniref:N-acetylneuraminate synthase family protein n=1 Tax=Flammeovirga yaeyamensis TaxID=367791 RepID=A0AAX1N8H4_9BACT|nr:N-acetylneuraminate synthase family protein [Flammeovirga yaeyamensis]MBB3699810.1 N-acetylneuraminate synthase [Flammeovirga yaeyamensis]NMF36621.1 N-acetylneuraminate synthase [Flammeovirga yaeyamensis]QWG02332.1 N-acetylneuraminate synthase family protein [Flammeovirga yaeyamensis]